MKKILESFFWILRRRIHQDLRNSFEPLYIIRLVGEVNKEDEGITVLMAACHQVLKSSTKKRTKKKVLFVNFLFLLSHKTSTEAMFV